VVVEAAAKSGSLITARDALDQGRDVLAVPGHPFDARAAGCNLLIRDGAQLVRGAEDVLAALPATPQVSAAPELPLPTPAPVPTRAAQPVGQTPPRNRRTLQETAALHQQILDRLAPAPIAEDQLIRDLALPPQDLTPALTDLELDGRIERQAGGLLARATG